VISVVRYSPSKQNKNILGILSQNLAAINTSLKSFILVLISLKGSVQEIQQNKWCDLMQIVFGQMFTRNAKNDSES
jgi:hypothetical protein